MLRLVVLPQALRGRSSRPTTSQFLNLVKNSSLAVAIGYPDLISITNTTLNQTGQAIEAIALAMTVYLAISLTLSLAMNGYNAAILKTRRTQPHDAHGSTSSASIRRAPMLSRSHECRSRPPSSACSDRATPAVLAPSSSGGWSTPSGRSPGRETRRHAAPPGARVRAGPSSPNALASSCAARIRSTEQWRPAVACLMFVALYAASTVRIWWNWRLLSLWIVLPAAAVALLRGGVLRALTTSRANSGADCR